MRLLLVGEWRFEHYEAALARGFEALGHEVLPVAGGTFFGNSLLSRIEHKTLWGPATLAFNKAILNAARLHRPDVVFIRRPVHISRSTVRQVRALVPRAPLITYNNDNPFLDGHRWSLWRKYFDVARMADWNYLYRPGDIDLARGEGIARPRLLLPWYIEGLHCAPGPEFHLSRDVVFVGHWESDGREDLVRMLADSGVRVDLFGPWWERFKGQCGCHIHNPVLGKAYVQELWSSRIALVFLSARNADVYTRRCFEIPACGTFMLAPRTAHLQGLFEEDREAVYYGSAEELVDKTKKYLADPDKRAAIAKCGSARVRKDRHSNIERARQIVSDITDWQMNN